MSTQSNSSSDLSSSESNSPEPAQSTPANVTDSTDLPTEITSEPASDSEIDSTLPQPKDEVHLPLSPLPEPELLSKQARSAPAADDSSALPQNDIDRTPGEVVTSSFPVDEQNGSGMNCSAEFEQITSIQREASRLGKEGDDHSFEHEPKHPEKQQFPQEHTGKAGQKSEEIESTSKAAQSLEAPWVSEAALAVKGNKKNVLNKGNTLIILSIDNLTNSCLLDSAVLQQASQPLHDLLARSKTDSDGFRPDSGIYQALLFNQNGLVPELSPLRLDDRLQPQGMAPKSTPAESVKSNRRQCKEETPFKQEEGDAADEGLDASCTDWLMAYKCFLRIITGKTSGLSKYQPTMALPLISGVISIAQKYDTIQKVYDAFRRLWLDYIHQQKLWDAIAQAPNQWMTLAIALKDSTVYHEAFKHLVGRSANIADGKVNTNLPEKVKSAISRKSHSLYDARMRAEKKLLMLTLPAIEPNAKNKKQINVGGPYVSQHKCPVEYCTVNILRDFMAEHIGQLDQDEGTLNTLETCDHKNGCDTVAGFHRLLHAGGNAYLRDDDVIDDWDSDFEIAFEEDGEFEFKVKGALAALKAQASREVAHLVTSTLQLGQKELEGLGYLTCLKVEAEDVPWDVEINDEDDEDMDLE